jgi:hypothetical protein
MQPETGFLLHGWAGCGKAVGNQELVDGGKRSSRGRRMGGPLFWGGEEDLVGTWNAGGEVG